MEYLILNRQGSGKSFERLGRDGTTHHLDTWELKVICGVYLLRIQRAGSANPTEP